MTQFKDVLETILEEYARRDSEGEFDTWEKTDAFVKGKAEVLLAYIKEEPVSNDFKSALAQEWKGYNDRGAATVDALEDNTQELAFAKGFYRGWHYRKEEPVSEDVRAFTEKYLRAYGNPDSYSRYLAFASCVANWQKKQTINKACDFFEEYLTEEECKFGISEWVEVKSNFDSIDSFIRAFKKYVEE